ncbi:hypothetical protein C1646_776623 [Rhizophagus diaphanus]|nr:hypothetical protein C1646_776623 [Rhizophagus diaphanus] [Rhizophagus sp. MUCL 43196]
MPWIKLQTRKNISFNALVIAKALDISIQYRRLALLPVQGRVARWYRDVAHLCTSRIDNIIIIDDMKIAEVNHWTFLLNIIPDVHRKQVIFIREPLADSDVWSLGKINKIRHYEQEIIVNYHLGYNDNGTICWQDMGRSIPAHCCKVAILDKESNMCGWSFSSEWLSSTHQSNILIPDNRLPTLALNPIISLPMIQDIWIHRWIDNDNLKMQLMDIRNILAERTMVEYYTDNSLRPSTSTIIGKQDPNLVYTDMGAAFCVNNEPALSAQANVSLWPSSTCSELVAIFLALLTGPMNAKIKIYTNNRYSFTRKKDGSSISES